MIKPKKKNDQDERILCSFSIFGYRKGTLSSSMRYINMYIKKLIPLIIKEYMRNLLYAIVIEMTLQVKTPTSTRLSITLDSCGAHHSGADCTLKQSYSHFD